MTLTVTEIYWTTWRIYRLLFRRSVATAAVVFAVVTVVRVVDDLDLSLGADLLLGIVGFGLDFAAPVVVQGALVEIVRNLHEARAPERIPHLLERARTRFPSLLWASIVYGFGVFFGLLLLIVPGVVAAARWCLMAPLIMLEDRDSESARLRSSQIVRGSTPGVALVLVIAYVLLGAPMWAVFFFVGNDIEWDLVGFVWNSLTAPFEAHLLTVLYYRFTDPARSVVAPEVLRWRSVWTGA